MEKSDIDSTIQYDNGTKLFPVCKKFASVGDLSLKVQDCVVKIYTPDVSYSVDFGHPSTANKVGFAIYKGFNSQDKYKVEWKNSSEAFIKFVEANQ